jgi:hypothetical protein
MSGERTFVLRVGMDTAPAGLFDRAGEQEVLGEGKTSVAVIEV